MTDKQLIENEKKKIQCKLSDLAHRIRCGNEADIFVWIVPGIFACAHRPLRYHREFGSSGQALPIDATPHVRAWVERIWEEGIKSIICLLSEKEIFHYSELDLCGESIIGFYEMQGFMVSHLPWPDPHHRPNSERATFQNELCDIREKALACLEHLPRPTLIHCSAGQDRSAPVAAYIKIAIAKQSTEPCVNIT